MLGALGSAAADTVKFQQLGDRALGLNDYTNAIKFYELGRSQFAPESPQYNELSVRLASAYCRADKLDRARAIIAELEKSQGPLSLGILPGELLFAEGKPAAAADFLRQLLTVPGLPPELTVTAETALAEICRYESKYEAACEIYRNLESNPDRKVAERAHLSLIETLIQGGKYQEADALLKKGAYVKNYPVTYTQLQLLLDAKMGDFADFKRKWEAISTAEPQQRSADLYYAAARLGAEHYLSKGEREYSVELLKKAYASAANDAVKKNVLRTLINQLAGYDKLQAANWILQYLELYPDAADGTQLVLQAANIYFEARDFNNAKSLYVKVFSEKSGPVQLKNQAAEALLMIADKQNDTAAETKLLEALVRNNPDTELLNASLFEIAKYYQESQHADKALRTLDQIIQNGGSLKDRAILSEAQILLQQKKYDAVLEVAKPLSASKSALADEAMFYQSVALEKLNRKPAARELLLSLQKEYPGSKYLSNAQYLAARIAFENQEFDVAAREFLAFYRQNTADKLAVEALFFAMQSAWLSGDRPAALQILEMFKTKYAQSTFCRDALFQMVDFYRADNKNQEALAQLTALETAYAGDAECMAEILFCRAQIYAAQKDTDKAQALLKELLEKYVKSSFVDDAAFLLASLAADRRDFKTALEYYKRALELNPSGAQTALITGRIADCYYEIYCESLEMDDLKKAIEIYRKSADVSVVPTVKLQSLYKLGKSLELADNLAGALDCYERILYLADNYLKDNQKFDIVWVAKAAQNACLAYSKNDNAASRKNIARIIGMYKAMNLPDIGELDRIYQEIQRKNKLKEK